MRCYDLLPEICTQTAIGIQVEILVPKVCFDPLTEPLLPFSESLPHTCGLRREGCSESWQKARLEVFLSALLTGRSPVFGLFRQDGRGGKSTANRECASSSFPLGEVSQRPNEKPRLGKVCYLKQFSARICGRNLSSSLLTLLLFSRRFRCTTRRATTKRTSTSIRCVV